MELFLDNLPQQDKDFQKEAGFAARVSEAPENWPQEITSELHKQLPFLSDYDVRVNLDKVEPQRGFAFGYADVTNKTERPEIEHKQTGIPHIRIPIIIENRAARPFSIFLDGERVLPLNEDRIRHVLFNPSTFDLSTVPPRDPSLVEPLMPPQRSGIGMGGEFKMASVKLAMTPEEMAEKMRDPKIRDAVFAKAREIGENADKRKFIRGAIGASILAAGIGTGYAYKKHKEKKNKEFGAEKRSSILTVIAPTIREEDVQCFVDKVASDPTLQAGFKRSGIAPTLVEVFENTKRASASERLETISENIEPTVMTVQKLPGGDFLVKSANVHAFVEKTAQGEVVPAQQAEQAIGPQNAQAMQPGHTATVVSQPVEGGPLYETNEKVADEFGEYLVQDSLGNRLLGWVFPRVLSWTEGLQPQDIALFNNGSAYAFQDAIAGELVGKSTTLPSDAPRGDGVFYSSSNGKAVVTAPITIQSTAAGPDGQPHLIGHDVFGNQISVSQTEGLKTPQAISPSEFAIPADWKFMRLNNQVQLASDPVQMNKFSEARALKNSVTLFWNGAYNVEGGCGLQKISRDFRYDLDPVGAEFLLGLLGVDGNTAKQKLAEVRKGGAIDLTGLHSISLLSERYAESIKTASSLMNEIPDLRRDLIKEAASIEDEGTVDKVLSLNFINPENLAAFVDYIPELEETSEKLAEMLLLQYLGLKDLPEGAIERCMKNMEEVIRSLKAIQHAES